METQIKAFYKTPQGIKFVTIFGYATKGVPSLEINGVGKLSKNIKEKLIYLTRLRKIQVPLRRFVVCVDANELNEKHIQHLKWLEFPLLLTYWYLCGIIPIRKLDNCLTSGWVKTSGDVYHMNIPVNFRMGLRGFINPIEAKSLKLIGLSNSLNGEMDYIDTSLLLEHIPNLRFKLDHIESDSAIPMKSFIT